MLNIISSEMDFIYNPFLLVTKDLTDIQKSSDTLPPKPCVSLGNFPSDVLVHMCACVCVGLIAFSSPGGCFQNVSVSSIQMYTEA